MVWWLRIGLDNLHAVFPSHLAIWLYLFALDCEGAQPLSAEHIAHRITAD